MHMLRVRAVFVVFVVRLVVFVMVLLILLFVFFFFFFLLFVAIFFAYLMSPLVNYLEKLLRGRGRAIAVIYALMLALLVMFFVSVGPRVTREGARLGQAIPALLTQLN